MINSISLPILPNKNFSLKSQSKNIDDNNSNNNIIKIDNQSINRWPFTFKEHLSKFKIPKCSNKIRNFLNESFYSRNKSVSLLSNIYNNDDDNYSLLESMKSEFKNHQANILGTIKINKPIKFTTDTPMDFYEKFRKFNRLYRMNHESDLTPSFSFIKAAMKERVIPNPNGFISKIEDESKIQLTNSMLGDKYINAMSNSFNNSQRKIKEMLLSSNRISANGVNCLFKNINLNQSILSNLTNLDLSNNKIGNKEIEPMLFYLKNIDCRIEKLNLEKNQLGDSNISFITSALGQSLHQTIKEINFANNGITYNSVKSIIDYIINSKTLILLNLNWNSLSNNGAAKIVKALRGHSELKVLYLAWNNIGTALNEPSLKVTPNHNKGNDNKAEVNKNYFNFELQQQCNEVNIGQLKLNASEHTYKRINYIGKSKDNKIISQFAKEFGDYCKSKSQLLVHLDLSHNYLSYNDCEYMANKIKDNHSILGFHTDGNEMMIDALGFIYPMTKNIQDHHIFQSQMFFKPTMQSPKKTKIVNKIANQKPRKVKCSNCWICEEWNEVEFCLTINNHSNISQANFVKLHLNIDEWKPYDLMGKDGTYAIVRMCPPGDIYYFFTINMIPVSDYPNDEKIHLAQNKVISYKFDSKYIEDYYAFFYRFNQSNNVNNESIRKTIKNTNKNIKVKIIGHKIVEKNGEVVNEDYKRFLLYCYPRPQNLSERLIKPSTPWTFKISIWAYYNYSYEGDSEDYLTLCFEHDFKRCLFEKDFNEEDLIKVKTLLRTHYREILNCYKQFSSLSGFNLWQISQNNLADLISKCPGLCDKKYDINNVFIVQTGICANLLDKEDKIKNGNKNIGDNIIRHQFLSLLIKVPRDKYVRVLKSIENTYEAIEYSFNEHFVKGIAGYGYHQWRIDRYYNEQVDNFLKAFYPIFDSVFKSWSKQKGPRKKDVWMVLDEFNNLIQCIVDCNEYPIRDNPLLFNWSIRLQISEITSDKHLYLLFPEFLEAICRVIDKASPYPPKQYQEAWPMSKRINQPLIKKLENSIDTLIKVITHPEFKIVKDKFIKPIKDQMTDLYMIDYSSNFYQGLELKNKQ